MLLSRALGAPVVTEEEERAERAALTDTERKRYLAEIYGTEAVIDENDDMIQQGLELFQGALDSLSPDDKRDYEDAVQRAPELVETESPRISFLRACQYDAWAAARRLIDYWSTRKKMFGQEKAFLPMTLDGAMEEDVQYLEKALFFQVPDDAHDRAVYFVDRARIDNDVVPRDSAIRCMWYVFQTFVEKAVYQHRGYVMIANFRGFNLYRNWDRMTFKKGLSVINCMPIRWIAAHLCTGAGTSVTKDLILPMVRQMGGKNFRMRYQLHAGSRSEILERFQDYGLGESHLQAIFGGEVVNRVTVEEWLRERRLVEQARDLLLQVQE